MAATKPIITNPNTNTIITEPLSQVINELSFMFLSVYLAKLLKIFCLKYDINQFG